VLHVFSSNDNVKLKNKCTLRRHLMKLDTGPEFCMVPLTQLILLESNPRKISKEAMDKLCNSMREDPNFFLLRPCLVNRLNGGLRVYAGNQRIRAAIRLKMKEVPCLIEDDVSEKLIKARIIKDNKTYGTFDYDILGNEYEIDELLDAGFTPEELDFNVDDIHPKEEDEKKQHECPACGHKF